MDDDFEGMEDTDDPDMIDYDNKAIMDMLDSLHDIMTASKPNDRSERDRRFAVTITKHEETIAYFKHWVVRDGN